MSHALRLIIVCYASISAGLVTGVVAYTVLQAIAVAHRYLRASRLVAGARNS